MPDGSYGGNPCGFVVETRDGNFYYSGDTALTYDMKLIGERTSVDFAVLPIGDFYTMGIEDAVRAAEFVGTTKIVGVHYDTFPPIKIDQAVALKIARRAGKELFLPKSGNDFAVSAVAYVRRKKFSADIPSTGQTGVPQSRYFAFV